MSATSHPIQVCDADDGMCGTWEIDIPATGARLISGADPLAGWFIDRAKDVAYCPDHADEADR